MPEEQSSRNTYSMRVIGIYATRWRYQRSTSGAQPGFEWGHLREFYELYQDQLPRTLIQEPVSVGNLTFRAPEGGTETLAGITAAEFRLFALPSDQVVAAIILDFTSPDLNADSSLTVKILEVCAYIRIQIMGADLASHIGMLAVKAGAEAIDIDQTATLPPERHQIVFARELPGEEPPDEDVMKSILYRIDPPYRQEFMKLARPSALNQEARTLGAVTPYVSLLFGHQDYVHNSAFLTTVQAVGTAARFREIWHAAHQRVQTFRESVQAREVGQQRRADLEVLVDELGNLELDLSFSVETPADLGLLIPSLRIESFHRKLYGAMELPKRAKTVSQMFVRLDSSIKSELRAIEIRERREEEGKRLRGAIAVSVLSFVGVPLGFIVAFFGINAVEVRDTRSIFDFSHYMGVYITAIALALIPIIVFVILHGNALRKAREVPAAELARPSRR